MSSCVAKEETMGSTDSTDSTDASYEWHPTSLFYVIVVGSDEVKSSSKHLLVQRQQQKY